MLDDLLRGFRSGGWLVRGLVLWACIVIITALANREFARAIDWAASLATWLVIIYFLGVIQRLRDQLKECS